MAGIKGVWWDYFVSIPSTFTTALKQGKTQWVSAGNMKYFQTKRESLKLGNADMCLCEAYFIPSAQVQLGLINGLWKSVWYQKQGDWEAMFLL